MEISVITSISAMRIISGANKDYEQFYLKLKEDTEKFGYKFSGYDYGGLCEGIKFDVNLINPTDYTRYIGKIPGKPKVILDALERFDDFIVYLDSDIRIRRPIDNIKGDYDIGVTAHDPCFHEGEERCLEITGFLNAGVVFANNTVKARDFIVEWIKEVEFTSTGSDQEALTNLLRRHIEDWSVPEHEVVGAKVRLFPSPEYNYTRIRGEHDNPRLVHYTGTVEDKIKLGALL